MRPSEVSKTKSWGQAAEAANIGDAVVTVPVRGLSQEIRGSVAGPKYKSTTAHSLPLAKNSAVQSADMEGSGNSIINTGCTWEDCAR
eukprot:scaffold3498_cov176-Amphora_coffeaeformis.AAC.2